MQIDATTATILGAAVASIVGGGFAVCNMWLTRRSDERRQIRELAIRAAIENWKIYNEASQRVGGAPQPLDVYLIHAMHLVSALDGSLKTPKQIEDHLRQTFVATDAATAVIEEWNKKLQERRKSVGQTQRQT